MLELLAEYANKNVIGFEPGFKSKYIRWAIILDSKKGFLGIQELGNPIQKRNQGIKFNKCPEMDSPLMQSNIRRCHFLAETCNVIALLKVAAMDAKTKEKHQFFYQMLNEAGKHIPQIKNIYQLLMEKNVLDNIRKTMEQKKIKPTDKVTFKLDGDFPLDNNYWHSWWRDYRRNILNISKPQSKRLMRCFITGNLTVPSATHSKIEGLANVGGSTNNRDSLVSFDKESFRSYGLEQSANAAVSEEAMNAYCAGLNELIRNHSYKLAETKIVHWFKESVKIEDDIFAWLEEPPEQTKLNAQHQAKQLLDSIKSGKRPELINNIYYALILSGASGRVVIRDWLEGQFEELVENINFWFSDLEIVKYDDNYPIKSNKFSAILSSLVSPDLKIVSPDLKIPSPIVSKLWRCAVLGELIPHTIMAQSLLCRKMEIIQAETKRAINSAGMGLIKAYHLRNYRKEENTEMSEMLKPELNENFPSTAYQCGRLLAVLADLQKSALGDVGSGVIQRYYASASTTPALVLGRLSRTSQYHLDKLDTGLARWYESKIAEIYSKFRQPPPKTLLLEEQSLFALGYYQQLAAMRNKKTKNINDNKEGTND